MASLVRLGGRVIRLNPSVFRPCVVRAAGISTSKKNKDTVNLTDALVGQAKTQQQTDAVAEKNWISWGFSYESETKDNTVMHLTFFCSVTLCLVFGGFIWAYMPDYRMIDWAQREGYLELRRREAEGLPLIDPNLVSIDKVQLPEDEELGDTEIII
ncbi:NADH dehydrogenase [ubiquinone] 1 beta subcomplex subunit 11, mitochondrial-like [Penaeus japonicus]|uniref:NADH dehydrogenase [ubiquinone] 1 beta subcomplex subunit 11, mitochondrial-like n=1 Tax=Penaeus japonicus TaxID=27405 RepID=UPI001C70EE43|nr:NADH dehydrogenase [ubiquinone] 1 beta subcomplex subunit 11, mitochondrial-like [Penaeus japonicus]